jgi:putative Mg2+ transporter-C (MgtC) family protein
MLSISEMLIRLFIALILGLLIGLERELAGKEIGIRTNMLVTTGAALFSLAGISLPYIISSQTGNLADVIARNSGFLSVIANVVVGIGFLGGGIIVKQGIHVRSVTTAALIWFAAAVGVLCGIGMLSLAVISTVIIVVLLFLLKDIEISTKVNNASKEEKDNNY